MLKGSFTLMRCVFYAKPLLPISLYLRSINANYIAHQSSYAAESSLKLWRETLAKIPQNQFCNFLGKRNEKVFQYMLFTENSSRPLVIVGSLSASFGFDEDAQMHCVCEEFYWSNIKENM